MFTSRGNWVWRASVEDTLEAAEKVPKKNVFSLMISRKRAFVDEKKGAT